MRLDDDHGARARHSNSSSQVSRLAIDFNAVMKELFKERNVKDAISHRLRAVDLELLVSWGSGRGGGFLLSKKYSISKAYI